MWKIPELCSKHCLPVLSFTVLIKISSVNSNSGYQVNAEYPMTVYRAQAAVLFGQNVVNIYIQFFELCRCTSVIQLFTQTRIGFLSRTYVWHLYLANERIVTLQSKEEYFKIYWMISQTYAYMNSVTVLKFSVWCSNKNVTTKKPKIFCAYKMSFYCCRDVIRTIGEDKICLFSSNKIIGILSMHSSYLKSMISNYRSVDQKVDWIELNIWGADSWFGNRAWICIFKGQ